jgi:hypothetical protein
MPVVVVVDYFQLVVRQTAVAQAVEATGRQTALLEIMELPILAVVLVAAAGMVLQEAAQAAPVLSSFAT